MALVTHTVDASDVHLSAIRFYVVRGDGRFIDFTDFVTDMTLIDHVNIAGMEADIGLQGEAEDLLKLGGEGTEIVISAPLYSLEDRSRKRRELFRGMMEDVVDDRVPGSLTRTLTCYDIAYRLAMTEEDLVFKGKTLSQIVSSVANSFDIPKHSPFASTSRKLGNIVSRGGKLWDAIQDARQKHYDVTGDLWLVRARKGRLEMVKVGDQTRWWLFEEEVSLQSLRRQRSLSEVVNSVKIYGEYDGEYDKPPVEATVSNAASKKLYGLRQRVEYRGDQKLSDVKDMARTIVKRQKIPEDRVTVTGWAVPTLRAGDQIKLTDDAMGMNRRTYYVESMETRWNPEQSQAYATCLRDVPDPDILLEATSSA